MPETHEDRVAGLMREFDDRSFLESTHGEDLIIEMVEAGLRAKPELQARLEDLYQREDEIVRQHAIDDLIRLITRRCEETGREVPTGLETMTRDQLEAIYDPMFQEKNDRNRRLVERLQRELGPLVRVKLERIVIAPETAIEDAKRLCLEHLNEATLSDALELEADPKLTYDQVHPLLYQQMVQPIVEDESTR